MSQTADPKHGHEVGGAGARDFDRLVGGHAGAGERSGVERVDAFGDLDDVVGVGGGVLAEAAVDRVTHHLLLVAQRLPAGHAVVATAARVAEPGHRDAVTDRDLVSAIADSVFARRELRDDADTLVARYERWRGLDRPVAVRGVDVGMAQAARLDLHAQLPVIELRHRDLLDSQRAGEVADDRGTVGGGFSL